MNYCPHCMSPTEGNFCLHCGSDQHNPKWSPHQLPVGSKLTVGGGWRTYQIGEALGQGGFGITYIGLLMETQQRVAVKEFYPSRCAQRKSDNSVSPTPGQEDIFASGMKSFLREARLLAGLKPMASVVRALDFFQENGTAYLVMEYLDGVPLNKKVADTGCIPPSELLLKMRFFLTDLDAIHREGVVHRDVSPDNIMWMPDGSLKLMDFGCARSMEDGKSTRVMLKPGFAPVEQYQSRGQGPWTDVYGIAATIYYCLTAKIPVSAIDRLDGDNLPSPRSLGADLTPEQDAALMWGLTVQPKFRPESVAAFAAQLCPQVTPVTVVAQWKDKLVMLWNTERSKCLTVLCIVLAVLLLISLLTGCASTGDSLEAAKEISRRALPL